MKFVYLPICVWRHGSGVSRGSHAIWPWV